MLYSHFSRWLVLVVLVVVVSVGEGIAQQRAGGEIQYPGKAFAKLDTFESLNLQDADKLFAQKDYTGAFAAYKAYSFEFARSPALPYVLLRMGRCLHHLGKRNAAIKAYQDVVDYFPDDIRYAAAALFYIGQCHGQNGDEDKQTAVWARMVKDDDYVTQPNSGTALAFLGKKMAEMKKFEEAIDYHWRTAVTFHQSNPNAARDAREAVIEHYVLRNPSHEKLTQFYKETNAYGDGHGNPDDPENDWRYWRQLQWRCVRHKDEDACRYWVSKLAGRMQDNDEIQVRLFEMQKIYEKDNKAWLERIEKQYKSKPASLDRVMQWLEHFPRDMEPQRAAFFKKYGGKVASGLKFGEIMSLMDRLRRLGMHDEAQAAMRAVKVNNLESDQIKRYADFVANYEEEETVIRILNRIKDPLEQAKAKYDYYWSGGRNIRDAEKALEMVQVLKKSPKHVGQNLSWSEAELLRKLGRYEEAIKAYRAANRQPDSTFEVTECLIAMKQYGEAIKNVQGLESVGGAVASRAAFKVADIYRITGDKGKEVDQLRLILRRYPKSGESSKAHERLEGYGVKLVGGVAEAEE